MGIFEKKQELSRPELRNELKRASGSVPASPGTRYSQKERVAMEKELFGPKYGGGISTKDYQKAIKGLTRERLNVKTAEEKKVIERQIRYLKKLGGI